MFWPKPMRNVNIFVQEEDIAQLTIALARLETLDVVETEARAGWSSDEGGERWSELGETYADQSRRLERLLQTLEIPRQETPLPEQLAPEQDASTIEAALEEIEPAVQDWQNRQKEIEKKIERLRLLLESMRLLKPLDISVEAMRNLRFLYLTVGTLPKENLENLQIVLFRIPFVIIPVHEYDERVLIFAATDQAHAPILQRALSSVFMETLELPQELSGAPAQVVGELRQQLDEAERQRDALAEERADMAELRQARLLALWSQAHNNQTVVESIDRLSRHGEIYLISGWTPEQALDELLFTVQNVAEGRADIEVLEPIVKEDRQVPSLLRNPALLRPFETLVTTYGFPAYDEIDPTPLVALSFLLMYGIMFGDVGHGLLLALVGLWLWRRSQGQVKSLGAIVTAAGLSGTVFGFLFGSIFGREDILPHLWLSPLESIGDILLAAIIAGVVLLNVGFILHLIGAWRNKAWGRLLFSRRGLAGLWLYWALVGGGLALWWGAALPGALWALLVLIPAALIFLHQPLGRLITGARPLVEAGWGEYSVESFFELFEAVIANISNSLSFVRLGAFAVAHVGLSQVVFLLADIGDSLWWRWLVIAVGTLVIVGFEGLIVGIQALRLEYYEFFSKFFGGRGRVFTPFRLSKEAEQA